MREGGAPWRRLDRKTGVSEVNARAGNRLPHQGLQSSGRGGKAGTRAGRTPCLPYCLPDGIPVSFCDRASRNGPSRAHPLNAGPGSLTV
jgi:hypothetical protein